MSQAAPTGSSETGSCQEPLSPALLVGIEEFNQGKFFECHDTFEELWMAESRPIRALYQGILQIGVAFHHLKAGRYQPVVTLLSRGSNYLVPFEPQCMGVDVSRLRADAARCLAQVEALGPDGIRNFNWSEVPKIGLVR